MTDRTVPASAGVVDIANAVRNREISAAEVIGRHLEAAVDAQSRLNAFTLIDEEAALAAAEEIDRRVLAGEPVGPLAGAPVGVKDLIDQQGRPTTNGGNFPPDVPNRSATCVERLEAADAVIIGRTGLHEFAFGFSSENHWFGPIRNPWDPALSPGGSSGGSATAVAAGLASAALGTDTGGSVRVPAALCGLVGLKVTHGRIPLTGVTPLAESVDTVGPLARTVGDAAAIYTVIAGDDPADPWSRPQPVISPGRPTELGHLRVGIPRPWADQPVAADVRAAVTAACDAMAAAGATMIDLELPDLDFPGSLEQSMYPEVAQVHRERLQSEPDRYGPVVRRRLQRTLELDLDDYIEGLRWRSTIRSIARRALGRVDVLATPTVASVHKTIGEDLVDVDGEPVPYRPALSRFTALVNHLGFPALALPLVGTTAPPASLQLIGAPWMEHHLLEVGRALELLGVAGWRRPPQWRSGSAAV